MTQKTSLGPYHLLSAQQMSNGFTTAVTAFPKQNGMSFDVGFTGTPTGNFFVDFSNSYQATGVGIAQTVISAGTWTPVGNLSPAPTAAGQAGSCFIELPAMNAHWTRMRFVPTGFGAETIATVADVSGSLASKWFTICDGAGTVFAIWFKVSGTGTSAAAAAANPTATLVEQDITTNDTAATIGSALATTIAALNSTNSFTASGTSTVTVANKVAGPFQLASAGTSGFTVTNTAGAGICDIWLHAKGY